MADEITGTPQPEGQEGGADVPYREYLERISEEHRGEVQPVFEDWNKQVNSRFEQQAEARKQWEPYEQAGIRNVDPEELQGWLQFRQAAMENPQAIAEWYQQYAAQNGLTAAEQQQQQFDEPQFGQDPGLEQLLEQRLGPVSQQLEELRAWQQQQEEARRTQAATEYIEGQISELQQKHGDQFNRDWVEKFIPNHIESDPQNAVARAFEDYQKLVSTVEKQLVDSKARQPQPAETGGMASTQAEGPRNIKDANAQALAQLRGLNST